MITREEAAALASVPLVDPLGAYARTVVALYDERAKVTAERDAARIVLQQLAPLDRVEWVWPDDFPDGERPDCLCSACGDAVLVETGHEWAQGRDVCHDCAAMRSEALSAVTRERDALRENQRGALAAIQSTAESAEKYAAKADTLAAMLASERDLSAKLEMELRRLRAAEAPGTDDDAFAGTGWAKSNELRPAWIHTMGWYVYRTTHGWTAERVDHDHVTLPIALDAMCAVVPGSV